MISLKKMFRSLFVSLFCIFSLTARDVIVEMKGAYFWPTNSSFRHMYHNGGLLYGPEATVQLCEDQDWYVFGSLDYFHKGGHSLGLCDPTKITLIPLALGLKYFAPLNNDSVAFYLGLGLEWMYFRTKNCSEFVVSRESGWGLGGIGKIGAYYYAGHNFFIDIFADYSYAKVGSNDCDCQTVVESRKANVSGAIVGIGLAYNF